MENTIKGLLENCSRMMYKISSQPLQRKMYNRLLYECQKKAHLFEFKNPVSIQCRERNITRKKIVNYEISNDLCSIILRHNHIRESLPARCQSTKLRKVSLLTFSLQTATVMIYEQLPPFGTEICTDICSADIICFEQ